MKTFVCKHLVEANNTGWYSQNLLLVISGLMPGVQSAMKLLFRRRMERSPGSQATLSSLL